MHWEQLRRRIEDEILGNTEDGRWTTVTPCRYGPPRGHEEDCPHSVVVAYDPSLDHDWHQELEQVGRILDEFELWDVQVVFKPGEPSFV